MQPVRKSILAAAVAAAAVSAVAPTGYAAALTPGNLMVLRVGDGSIEQAAGTASVWIDEYSPTGSFVQTFTFASTGTADGAETFTMGATVTTEGTINFSTDGQYLVFAGYRRDVTTANSPGSRTSIVAPRAIGRLSISGALDASTIIRSTEGGEADLFSGSSVRGVASTDGTQFWVSGVSGGTAPISSGLVYVNAAGPTAVGTVLSNANLRGITIANGDLYVNSQTTVRRVTGGGLPTSGTVSFNNLASGLANSQNSVFFDLSNDVPGVDTFYVGDATAGNVVKYSLTGYNADDQSLNTWTNTGTVAGTPGAPGPFNITGQKNNDGSVTLYYTTTSANVTSLLNTLTDTSGFNVAPTGTFANLATSAASTSFRGVAVVPTPVAPAVPGDADGDGDADLDDIGIWATNFTGSLTPGAGTGTLAMGDFDADKDIDLDDQGIWASNFTGSLAPAGIATGALASVPEPATLSLLGLATLATLARRRRRA
jgi:hypothetical protein